MNEYTFTGQSSDYSRIERAIRFIEAHYAERPSLEQIAAAVHLSPFHFQRLFKRWAGISPAQFIQFLTLEFTKQRLRESQSIFAATLDAGLSGPGRLHDLFVSFEAMTPGEYKKQGQHLEITYGFHETPFGKCLIAITERGICHLSFVEKKVDSLQQLQTKWALSCLTEKPGVTQALINHIFSSSFRNNHHPFHLLLRGTNFQIHVWKALLSIPIGVIVSYQDIAKYIGAPKATRAAAAAIASNPLGYLIPCHRVISASGAFNKYQWGSQRKIAILGREASQAEYCLQY